MTDSSNPNNPPAAPVLRPGAHVIPSEPMCALLAMCVECGQGLELLLPIDQRALAFLLAQHGWFISVMSPPNQGPESPMLLGPLCTDCARKVYPAEVFAAAEQRRQQLLQSAEQAAQAYAAQTAEEPR